MNERFTSSNEIDCGWSFNPPTLDGSKLKAFQSHAIVANVIGPTGRHMIAQAGGLSFTHFFKLYIEILVLFPLAATAAPQFQTSFTPRSVRLTAPARGATHSGRYRDQK